jgi:phenylpropionate dioxygenase-like ring-hydroxylating dioxygenase large terminal subunit
LLPNEGDILRIREWMSQYYLPDFKQPSGSAEASSEPEAKWTFLAHAREVLPKRINTFTVADEELIAHHTQEGQLRVFEAHCPHQGAHLGRGGTRKDDCVGCPFHEFYFDADGAFRGQSPQGRPKAHMRLRPVPHRQAGQRVEVLV